MLFNSIPFLIFIVIFFLLWPFFNKKNNLRWFFITAMSLVFYGWWDWRFLFLIIGSGLIDFFAGLLIPKSKHKKLLLVVSLVANLGALSVFKYSVFFATVLEQLLSVFNLQIDLKSHIPQFALILPVGISFYTFQSMSYTIDIYRERLKPTKNILHFFSFLVMFPQLVAGPIVRAKDILYQLNQERKASDIQKWNAIKLFVFGLFQKTVLADNIGDMVNKIYGLKYMSEYGALWWIVLIGFAFQIYFDFSGYSLMARGIAKYMGYHFKMNFNHPYLATSFKSFWQRWHISLSTWFRDYVYIPLGGSKKGLLWGVFVMAITMLISGLWHGAGITFIIWGALHAFYLALERIFNFNTKSKKTTISKYIYSLLIFILVVYAWNFFRSNSLNQAIEISKQLFSFNYSSNFFTKFLTPLIFLTFAILIELSINAKRKNPKIKWTISKYNIDIVLVIFAITFSLFFRGPEAEFIYFQF